MNGDLVFSNSLSSSFGSIGLYLKTNLHAALSLTPLVDSVVLLSFDLSGCSADSLPFCMTFEAPGTPAENAPKPKRDAPLASLLAGAA